MIINKKKKKWVEPMTETSYSVETYCCKKMKYAMTSKKILTYNDGSGHFNRVFEIKDGVLKIPLSEEYNGGGHDNTQICFCPWCGESIKTRLLNDCE